MKTSKFTGSQIMSILKQAESGKPVAALCREHVTSNATFYKWRQIWRYGYLIDSSTERAEQKIPGLKRCMRKND
ncbi:transposase [Acinetobacter pollinis]|uniref:transposase n=1 Tax=Acinetobacter pollinis TaxID=2605270 RepID=UPI00398A6992